MINLGSYLSRGMLLADISIHEEYETQDNMINSQTEIDMLIPIRI